MRTFTIIALVSVALAACAMRGVVAPAPAAAPAAAAAAPAAADASAVADPTSPNQPGADLSAEDDDVEGDDPPVGFFTTVWNKLEDAKDWVKGVFVNLYNKLPTGSSDDYVDGEMCELSFGPPKTNATPAQTRTIPMTKQMLASESYRAGCSKRFMKCAWNTEFGQPDLLATHPLWGEKINMWFYGVDTKQLPASVTGKTFAEDPAWTTKLLGTATSPGLCNSFKPGDDDKVQYASCYSGKYKVPIYVAEILTPQLTAYGCKDGCVRYDKFLVDSRLGTDQLTSDDWTGTSMDRGHLSPNADTNTTPQRMCTFFTTNIFFQTDLRNRLVWAAMEDGLRDSMYDKGKFSKVAFDKIYVYNSLVYTLPGVAGADKLYTMKTRRKNEVPVPYFAFKFLIACKAKTCLINIAFLDNPDPNKQSSGGMLTDTYSGSHLWKCPKSSANAMAHVVSYDEKASLSDISPCFDANLLGKMTVQDLVKASQLDYSSVLKAVADKGYKVITNVKITDWTG